jgi:hypothetical protein
LGKGRKEKREREREVARGFFLRIEAGHTLLAMPGEIFAVVRCN